MIGYLKLYVCALLLLLMGASSCSRTKSYADYVNEENSAISSYLKKENIEVVNTMPTGDDEWFSSDGRPVYFKDSYGMYYHQIAKGEGTMKPQTGYTAYVRYVGTDLDGQVYYSCTSKTSADPVSFTLSSSSGSIYGVGFQNAVRLMRAGGNCRVIIPFSVGNGTNQMLSGLSSSDMGDYRPMVYDIWLVNVE
ncbi:MAG: DUF4827 family protein [Paludibacteraceae bacterium]|nr:DUF4827 family protein [Paludibacteraceae bacterium]MBR4841176.1 DUF4827 family protein [Paludibacteraceae bacterium]